MPTPSELARIALRVRATEERRYDWDRQARPTQRTPLGSWRVWLILAGRGFGKTRTGAEWVKKRVQQGFKRILIAGATAGDVRDIMIEGESGLLNIYPEAERPRYEPSKMRITFASGAIGILRSADEPERFRGLQCDSAWVDELASWRYPEAWDQIQFGLRLGNDPRIVATTTPRSNALTRALVAASTTHVTRGSTYDNRANLPPAFFEEIIRKYEGTRLGRQEINAEILDDVRGALWSYGQIDALRIGKDDVPDLHRVVVAIDPAVSAGEDSDETGLVVAGIDEAGEGYVLEDLSGQYTPDGWAKRAVEAYRKFQADRIIAEVNNGGEMVEHTIRTVDPNVAYSAMHASRGKRIRAEPVAALYEQGRVHHVGSLGELEKQMCEWDASAEGGPSPDRVDALVWALSELMVDGYSPQISVPEIQTINHDFAGIYTA